MEKMQSLEFTPTLGKKGGIKKVHSTLFKAIPKEKYLCGCYTGISVEIVNIAAISFLYSHGFGKGSKSRSAPNFALEYDESCESCIESTKSPGETLTLVFEEAFYLSYYLKFMEICDLKERKLDMLQFLKIVEDKNQDFIECLSAYIYLRNAGWIIKSGAKFGANYLIYKEGPICYHASFLVLISKSSSTSLSAASDIKGVQRVAETSDKDVLILEVNKPSDFKLNSPYDIKDICIKEMIIRRVNYSALVQRNKI